MAAHSRADSATGGSADTQAVDLDARQWRTRRGAALAVRAAAILVPVATSVAAARVVAVLMPRPDSVARTAIWWLCVAAAAVLTLATVDRLARRLLPLAALCRLALVFPDRAPSRFRVALRAGTAHQLEQRIRAGGALGVTVTEAAENLLVLVASLTRHDRLTRGHSERVRAYADLIAEEMNLPRHDRERLHWSALVHDVGKMHVRPAVLNKRGRPDEVEWAELRNHPAAAAPIVEPLRPWLGAWVDAATQHHERVDGRGYPLGLGGADITLAGRIVAVADAYDCMTSARSYKRALPAALARAELARNSGTQFDAEVVRAFLAVSVGRLHLVAGTLAWSAQLPGLAQLATATSAVGTTAVTSLAALSFALGLLPTDFSSSGETPAAAAVVTAAESARLGSSRAERAAAGNVLAFGPAAASSPSEQPPEAGNAAAATSTTTTTNTTTAGSFPPPPSTTVGPTTSAPASGTTTTTAPPAGSTTTAPPTGSTTTAPPTGSTTTAPPTGSTTTVPPATTTTTTTTVANQPPVAADDSQLVLTLTTTTIPVLANDYDPDGDLVPSSLRIVAGPSIGTASVVGTSIRYVAPLTLAATTTITYEVCDSHGSCAQATLTITIV